MTLTNGLPHSKGDMTYSGYSQYSRRDCGAHCPLNPSSPSIFPAKHTQAQYLKPRLPTAVKVRQTLCCRQTAASPCISQLTSTATDGNVPDLQPGLTYVHTNSDERFRRSEDCHQTKGPSCLDAPTGTRMKKRLGSLNTQAKLLQLKHLLV